MMGIVWKKKVRANAGLIVERARNKTAFTVLEAGHFWDFQKIYKANAVF